MKTYKENPSIELAKKNTVLGSKILFANKDKTITTEVYSNSEEEDIKIESINFHTRKIVDKDQFIMLYISAFPALSNLKKSTKLIFQYVLTSVNQNIGKDRLYLSHKDYCQKCENSIIPKISRASYFNGIKELLENEIIFQSTIANLYFINIAYIFNGNRLKFIQEYDLNKSNSNENE